eukprot:748935-Hanusia_phi.AAC.4
MSPSLKVICNILCPSRPMLISACSSHCMILIHLFAAALNSFSHPLVSSLNRPVFRHRHCTLPPTPPPSPIHHASVCNNP